MNEASFRGTQPVEADAEQQRRIAWEAEKIAEADADVAAGRLIDEADMDAWIDSLGTDHELPPPHVGNKPTA
jgi:predicted transcriptional regulator